MAYRYYYCVDKRFIIIIPFLCSTCVGHNRSEFPGCFLAIDQIRRATLVSAYDIVHLQTHAITQTLKAITLYYVRTHLSCDEQMRSAFHCV